MQHNVKKYFILQPLYFNSQSYSSPLSFTGNTQVSQKTSRVCFALAAIRHMQSTVWSHAAALTRDLCVALVDREGRVCMDHLPWWKQTHTPVTLAQTGKVSRSNMALPQLLMASVIHRMPIMFMTIPVLAMSATLR